MTASTVRSSRLALVTGTSSGIGEAVARELLLRGWRVAGLARRASPLEHDSYTHLQIDLADLTALPNQIEASIGPMLSSRAVSRLALVNNAADAGLLGTVDQVEPASMLRVFAVNVVAPTWLMGWLVRHSDASVPVRIVNVSSGAGINPYAGLVTYGGTKAALRMAGMVLGAEIETTTPPGGVQRDLTILSYGPGPVDTPMQAAARSAPIERFPLVETFARWAREGELLAPTVPAGEIATYLESDGYPTFFECRSGELRTPGPP